MRAGRVDALEEDVADVVARVGPRHERAARAIGKNGLEELGAGECAHDGPIRGPARRPVWTDALQVTVVVDADPMIFPEDEEPALSIGGELGGLVVGELGADCEILGG